MFTSCALAALALYAQGAAKLGSYAREVGGLAEPTAVVLDDDGTTYVLEWALDRVRVLNPDGSERAVWGRSGTGPGELSGPRDIERWSSGDAVYIADTGNHRIQTWSTAGEFQHSFGGPGVLNMPHGLAADRQRVYVADTLNDRVVVLLYGAQELTSFGRTGTGPGEFNHPLDVAVDDEGHIYVADSDNHRVQKFRGDFGEHLASWGDFGPHPGFFASPSGITCHGELVFVTDRENHRIQVFDPEGKPAYTWGLHAMLPRESRGKLHYPRQLAIAPGGALAVLAEDLEDRLQYFGPTPEGDEPPAASAMDRSTASHFGQKLDAGGGLLVMVEPTRPAVRLFDVATEVAGAEPIEIARIGAWGRGFGQMLRPEDAVLDSARHRVHVADPANRKVETWIYERKEGPLGYDPQMFRLAYSRDLSRAGTGGASVEPVALELHPDGHLVAIDARSRAVVQIGSTDEHERGGSRSAAVSEIWNGLDRHSPFDEPAADESPLESFREPFDLAFSPGGNRLYAVDRLAARVRWAWIEVGAVLRVDETRPGGELLAPADLPFVRPSGIAVDSEGRVFVSDAHRNAVYVYDERGGFQRHFGQQGLRELEFFKPSGLTLKESGELVILDHGNHRGQIATAEGGFVHAFGSRFFTQPIREQQAERARAGAGN
jgi:DNA-binding beta-propeller fold protein YncE